MIIYYYHGLRSNAVSGEGKVAILEAAFPNDTVIPLQYEPHKPVQTKALLESIFANNNSDNFVVGTSLGGFWGLYTARVYGIRSVIINPSTLPYKTMVTGSYNNYKIGALVTVTEDDIKEFEVARNDLNIVDNQSHTVALIALNDDVIDPKVTIRELDGLVKTIKTYPDGEHRFTRFSDADVIDVMVRVANSNRD